ncbi:hypothetical protein GCM10025771_13800 [Niveibacterium umoris]|uniref:Uncharacterized protein n=1 Tax=Niveibacterium umoris TaxID=1193620 RepID=A0A840BTZ3_9RHOO|nr:hypothetical protein [Niveibacterium umoris]MBB4014978.1 hypothetical protein [Niveibacterium umoris]
MAFSVIVVLTTILGLMFLPRSIQDLAIVLPAVVGAAPLGIAVYALLKERKTVAKALALSSIVSIPLGLACAYFVVVTVGLSAMSGMRW